MDKGFSRELEEADLAHELAVAEQPRERGPAAVRRKLIAATIELMSERSPAWITNKDIAARAGVNHGQIHHYFASKDDLVAKAIVAEATAFVENRLAGLEELPEPIDTRRRYAIWRGLAYLAVHAEQLDVASPVIGHLVETEAERRGTTPADTELMADIAILMSMRYGWSVFQDHIIKSLQPFGLDEDALREAIAHKSRQLLSHIT